MKNNDKNLVGLFLAISIFYYQAAMAEESYFDFVAVRNKYRSRREGFSAFPAVLKISGRLILALHASVLLCAAARRRGKVCGFTAKSIRGFLG